MLAMTYMYEGECELGIDLTRRSVEEVVRRGWIYDFPMILEDANGPRTDSNYYQNMMLWALPAAMVDSDLIEPCESGGLVDRVIKAGNPGSS